MKRFVISYRAVLAIIIRNSSSPLHPILPARTLAHETEVRLDHETKRNPSAECYAPFLGEDSRLGNIVLGRADDN